MSRAAVVLAALAASAAGCIGGQVLRGSPGYPFQTFAAPAPPDSVFLALQTLLDDEGFPLDYTRREEGLINTRRSDDPDAPLFLSVIVAADSAVTGAGGAGATDVGDETRPGSRVWVAGFTETYGGPHRVNPNDEELWARVVEVSEALSRGLRGTPPTGPSGPGAPPPPE